MSVETKLAITGLVAVIGSLIAFGGLVAAIVLGTYLPLIIAIAGFGLAFVALECGSYLL